MNEKDELKPVFMRPARFAKLLDYERSKIYAMLQTGELRGVKIGGQWRVPLSELDRLKVQESDS
jgi:excisionase family DNA binding protein